jgi:hypothetical protein
MLSGGDMTTPSRWDRPPRPTVGDRRKTKIYMAVGYALSQWEVVELRLASIYAHFLGVRPLEAIRTREYTKADKFDARSGVIESAGCQQYFKRNCSQALEGEFLSLMSEARAASQRRNDIAHGIARTVWGQKGEDKGFFLMPADYHIRKYPPGNPSYCFVARHICDYGDLFQELQFEASRYHDRLRQAQPP